MKIDNIEEALQDVRLLKNAVEDLQRQLINMGEHDAKIELEEAWSALWRASLKLKHRCESGPTKG